MEEWGCSCNSSLSTQLSQPSDFPIIASLTLKLAIILYMKHGFQTPMSCSSGSKLLPHSPFPSNFPNSLIFVSSSSKFAVIPHLQFCLRSPVSRSSSLDSSPLNQLSRCQRVFGLPHAIRLRIKMSQLCILTSLNHCTSKLQMCNRQFEDIGSHGTKVLVYNLWLNDEGIYELEFDEDDEDIKLKDEGVRLAKDQSEQESK